MTSLSEGSGGVDETTARTNRETALLTELLSGLDQTTVLLHAVARSYGVVLRRTGEGRLTQRDGEMVIAVLELQVEALREKMKAMGVGWRG